MRQLRSRLQRVCATAYHNYVEINGQTADIQKQGVVWAQSDRQMVRNIT